MEYWQKKQIEAEKRLRAALDKPLPVTESDCGCEGFFDPWDDLMDGCIGPYNSEIEDLAIDVIKAVRDRTTFELLTGPRAIASELFMHMLAVWLCSYGTSPRGVFPASTKISDMWPELVEKWESYAKIAWGDK